MATIHQRRLRSGDVVWELTHGTGKNRQRFTAGRSKEEAQEVLKQFDRQLALHGDAPKDDTIDAAVGLFDRYLQTNRRTSTKNRYLRILKTFTECFLRVHAPEVIRMRQIRPLHLEEFKRLRVEGEIREDRTAKDREHEQALRRELASGPIGAAHTRGRFGWLGRHPIRSRVSLRTINLELRVLFTFFHWCVKRNLLFLNPAQPVERFRLPKRALPKFMTTEDLKKFFGVCDDADRRLYMSILLTGMRKGEVEYLCWSDISFELAVIFIQEKPELKWQPKTDERLIPISPMLQEILLQHYASRLSDTLVFPNTRGNRDTDILERLQRLCRRAGIKKSTVHALRHSFGAHLRMAGASLADIGDLLGHKDLATTQIYAKVHQEHLRTVIAKLTPMADGVSGPNTPGIPSSDHPPKGLLGA